MRDLVERRLLAEHGVHFSDLAVYLEDEWRGDYNIAMDAQPALVTVASAGIPAFLANILDPQIVEIVLAPLRAAGIGGGEVKKGDWTTQSMMMPTVEPLGNIVAYGDYDNGGNVDTNVNWVNRQPFHYQTFKRIGERQLAMWGLAAIDYNARADRAVIWSFDQFQNRSYLFGVSGLMNYGTMNDPSLITPISPGTKAGGGLTWATATADEEYKDILALYKQLQTQMGGNLTMDMRMTLVISTNRAPDLNKLSAFNVSVRQMLRENFPNMTIHEVPEYSTASGELIQLVLPDYGGDDTIWPAFTEKFRAHPVVQQPSAWLQKFSAGTWGSIIRRPIAIGQMLGI